MRILTPMFQMKLFDRPNRNNVTNNVRSTEHTSLARDIASGFNNTNNNTNNNNNLVEFEYNLNLLLSPHSSIPNSPPE